MLIYNFNINVPIKNTGQLCLLIVSPPDLTDTLNVVIQNKKGKINGQYNILYFAMHIIIQCFALPGVVHTCISEFWSTMKNMLRCTDRIQSCRKYISVNEITHFLQSDFNLQSAMKLVLLLLILALVPYCKPHTC